MKKNAGKYALWVFVILVIVLMVRDASASVSYARDAVNMCLEMIVPTLFPFFICSSLLIYSGFAQVMARLFRFLMYPLFKVAPAGSGAFILGIISGYPLGAVTAGELYESNYLSKVEAERLLAFCNNSGPLFILGSVGVAVYANIYYGAVMYLCHIAAALTVGIIFRFYGKNRHSSPPTHMGTQERSVGEIFNISLQSGISSMLTVCGAVLFFSVASRLIIDLLPLNDTLTALISGIGEFVTGTVKIAALDLPTASKLIMTAAVVGFAGFSVHIQVMAVIAKYRLSLLPYIVGKILHALFSLLYMTLYFHINPITEAVFKPSMSRAFAGASLFEIITAALVTLSCIIYAFVMYCRLQKGRYVNH